MFGASALGIGIAADVTWLLLAACTLLMTLICGAVGAWVGPERVMRYMVRSQLASKASLDKGVSSFQIDGGRAWKIGEKAPPKYWDTWK
jgi:hypothetical protein